MLLLFATLNELLGLLLFFITLLLNALNFRGDMNTLLLVSQIRI